MGGGKCESYCYGGEGILLNFTQKKHIFLPKKNGCTPRLPRFRHHLGPCAFLLPPSQMAPPPLDPNCKPTAPVTCSDASSFLSPASEHEKVEGGQAISERARCPKRWRFLGRTPRGSCDNTPSKRRVRSKGSRDCLREGSKKDHSWRKCLAVAFNWKRGL